MDSCLIDSFLTDFGPTEDIDQIWKTSSYSPAATSFEDSLTGSPTSFDDSSSLTNSPEHDFTWANTFQDFSPVVNADSWLPPLPVDQISPAPFAPYTSPNPPPVSVVAPTISKKTRQQDKPESKTLRTAKRRKTDLPKENSEALQIPDNLKQAFATAEKGQIILSKEELLNLSSSLHEELLARVRRHRDLSNVEKQNVKRQRRLIKNRESAQASRQRKKTYVEELEKQVADLTNEKNQLAQNTTTLSNENTFLKSQVESLKAALLSKNDVTSSVLNRPAPSFKNTVGTIPPITPTSGLLFMILLFSFGIIFGNMQFINQAFVETADVLPGRIFVRDEFQPTSNEKGFKALVEDQNIPFVARMNEKLATESLPSEILPKAETVLMDTTEKEKPNQEAESTTASDMVWNCNATYLSCPTVQQISPPKNGPWSTEQDPTLVFLIPPSSLGAQDDSSTLEVTCQVTNIKAINQNSLVV